MFKNIALYFTPWLLIGWLSQYMLESLLAGSLLLLAWNYFNLTRLNLWLWHKRSLLPPTSRAVWGRVFDGVFRLQKKERSKRKSLGQMIRRFRDGADALPDAAVVFRSDASIVWCNKLAVEVLGLHWPEDFGNRLNNLIRHPAFSLYLSEKNFEEPLNLPSPVKPELMLEIRIMPYTEQQYLLMARDVTKVHQLEQMRKNFVANVSHELRTPLTVLQGYLELMQDPQDMDPAMWKKAHGLMVEQSHRMSTIVNQLLTLTKIESNTDSELEEEVNVPSMLELIRSEAEALSGESKHQICLSADSDIWIRGNSQELRSAFSNLIFNAVRYTQAEGNIDINWTKTPDGVTFSVQDSGEGIAADHLPRLTERFYRADKARSRATGGSGLGLSIVKHVLAHHKSELNITSELGKGSCFSFQLPKELVLEAKMRTQVPFSRVN